MSAFIKFSTFYSVLFNCRFIQVVTSQTLLNHHIIRKLADGVVKVHWIQLNVKVLNVGSNHSVVLVSYLCSSSTKLLLSRKKKRKELYFPFDLSIGKFTAVSIVITKTFYSWPKFTCEQKKKTEKIYEKYLHLD